MMMNLFSLISILFSNIQTIKSPSSNLIFSQFYFNENRVVTIDRNSPEPRKIQRAHTYTAIRRMSETSLSRYFLVESTRYNVVGSFEARVAS